MLAALALATLTTNVAANVVSPSYDFSNAWPKRISFRTGGIITGIIGVLIMPWNLLADPNAYIFTWLGTYGGATGPIAGVLIADYWWVRRRNIKLADLYRADGVYKYAKGWNWIAVVSLLVGVFIAIGGAYSATDGAPFPANGIIPFLKPFYDYSWAVGLAILRDLRCAHAHRGQEARRGPDRGLTSGRLRRPSPSRGNPRPLRPEGPRRVSGSDGGLRGSASRRTPVEITIDTSTTTKP